MRELRSVSVMRVVSVVVACILMALPSLAHAVELFRTNAVGSWNDGLWVDASLTAYAQPTSADVCFIGTDKSPGIAAAKVTMDGISGTAFEIHLGDDTNKVNNGESGILVITNGATLSVTNLAIGGNLTPDAGYYPHGELYMGPGTTLAVNNDVHLDWSSWTINSNNTVSIGGQLRLGDMHYSGPTPTARLTLEGGTVSIGGDFYMSQNIQQYNYLTLTNNATFNVGGNMKTHGQGSNIESHFNIYPGSMLNIAGNIEWWGCIQNVPMLPGDRVTVGGLITQGTTSTYGSKLAIDGGRIIADSLVVGAGRYRCYAWLYLTNNATISLRRPASGDTLNYIGRDGHLEHAIPQLPTAIYLGSPTDPGTIDIEEDGGSGTHSLTLSVDDSLDNDVAHPMLLTGWGSVDLDGTLQNNGKVIADGYGTERDLVMTNFAAIDQDESHTDLNNAGYFYQDGTRPGWYAVNKGRLILPTLTGLGAHSTVRWGDTINDLTIASNDIANSLLLDFTNCVGGDVSISLLAPDRSDHDATNDAVIGVWNIDGSGFDFGGSGTVTIGFRYDTAQAATKLLNESDLKAWKYNGSSWDDVTDSVDSTNEIVTTTSLSSCSLFAVSTLSPAAAGGLVLPQNLYRTNSVGLWDDGTWIDATASGAPNPTSIDDCYIGGDDGIGIADVTVTLTGLTVSVSNLYLGVDRDLVADGEFGRLILTNGASLRMELLGIGGFAGDFATVGKYSQGEIDMAPGTTLTVDEDAELNGSSWTIRSNNTVTLRGGLKMNNMGYNPNPTARLTIDGGEVTIGKTLDMGYAIRKYAYLTLTNNAVLNIGSNLTSRTTSDGAYYYFNIEPGSMLNISNDLLWKGCANTPYLPGDRVTVGGKIAVGREQSSSRLGFDGGRIVADSLVVGSSWYSDRTWVTLTNGAAIGLRRPDSGDVVNMLGQDGHIQPNEATLFLGSPTDPGTIDIEEDGGTGTHSLTVSFDFPNDDPFAGTMTLIGWGSVDLDGTLDNNGKIIADGYGNDRDLYLTNFAAVTQNESHDDQELTGFVLNDGTRAGWYAIRGGKLTLPLLTNLTAHATVRWGDTIDDLTLTSNDLVNSAMLNFTNCTGGDVSGSVIATNRTDDDAIYPDTAIGIWEFDGSAFTFGAGGRVQVTLRYDEGLMNAKGLTEADLKVWKFPGFGNSAYWENVTDTVNTDSNLIATTWLGALSQFVVSTEAPGNEPPPGTVIILR